MRHLFSILAIGLATSAAALDNEAVFRKAQAAYDDARYAEAAMLYESLLDSGVANVEVHYNLANANFKDGNFPDAVWHYRKAWYEAPRDPDIKANLHFALNAAGAAETPPTFVEQVFETLSYGEWIAVALTGYGLLTLLLILALLFPSMRRTLLKLCGLPILLILVSAGGWHQWQQLRTNPEWVVVKTEATTLYGPVEGSTAHYKLPLGALIRQRNTDPKGWVEVEYDGKRGWLKQEYIRRVSP